jgi:hypothetical protein
VRKDRSKESRSPLRIHAMVILNEKSLTFQFSPSAVVMKEIAESISGNAVGSVIHVHSLGITFIHVPKSFQEKKTRVLKTTTLSEVITTKLRARGELDFSNYDKPRRKLKPQSSELKNKICSHVVATNCYGTVGGRVVH